MVQKITSYLTLSFIKISFLNSSIKVGETKQIIIKFYMVEVEEPVIFDREKEFVPDEISLLNYVL